MRRLHSLVDHLAEIHGLVRELSPPSAEDDLKYGSHQSPGTLGKGIAFLSLQLGFEKESETRHKAFPRYLCNIHHVSHQSKAFQLELRDVSLQQHIDLREHLRRVKVRFYEVKRTKAVNEKQM